MLSDFQLSSLGSCQVILEQTENNLPQMTPCLPSYLFPFQTVSVYLPPIIQIRVVINYYIHLYEKMKPIQFKWNLNICHFKHTWFIQFQLELISEINCVIFDSLYRLHYHVHQLGHIWVKV